MIAYPFFSEDEEDEFGEALIRFIVKWHPNPERIGCPDSRILRDMAFRRKIAPEIVHEVTTHILKCAECVLDILKYTEEYKNHRKSMKKGGEAHEV